jgi:hypothetical protein
MEITQHLYTHTETQKGDYRNYSATQNFVKSYDTRCVLHSMILSLGNPNISQ